jgi:HEPN domain-containing protein
MDESARELVRDWLARAGRDLRSARLLAAADDPPLDIAIYHCQQAAEKSLKAWLQGQDIPFPKTHDLITLVQRASGTHGDFSQLGPAAAALTPYATAFRYPGGAYEPMPSREEFDEAVAHSEGIRDFVLRALPAEARP